MRKYLLVLSLLVFLMLATGTSVLAQGTVPPPPPPPPPCPIGAAGGTCTNGPASVTFPGNVLPNGSMVTIGRKNLNGLPPTGGFQLGQNTFGFSVTGPDGKPITKFSPDVKICFTLSAAEVAALSPSGLVIRYWNANIPPGGRWENQVTTQTPGTNEFCTSVNHFSIYGLFVESDAPTATSTQAFDLVGVAPWALALGAVLVLGAILVLRKK